jgi:hypothetical protein
MTTRVLQPRVAAGDRALRLRSLSVSSTSTEDENMLTQAVRDRYQCPKGFLDFRVSGELSPDAGYFQFGPNATCYGRTSNGIGHAKVSSAAVDVLPNVVIDDTQIVLPFDPNEVIDNLRLERYPSGQLRAREKTLKEIYYWLRPFTTRSMRGWIQQARARNWQERQFPRWPIDTSVESICENLLLLSLQAKGVERIPFVWFWPNGTHACVSMTHDVETEAGRDFCPQLLDIDESFGIKASFQIVPEDRYAVTPRFLAQIRDRGFEVGVQDLNHDGRLFDDREKFRRRAARINRYGKDYGAKGFRSGVLYRKPEWYQDLDFSFDMSMPNVAHLDPQRGGCCTVMPFFIGDLLEIPVTTIQDYTLFHLLNERSIDLWKTQVETIVAKNGLATFIVHPDYVMEPDTRAVYESLLGWLGGMRQERALWFALPQAIDRWWRDRSRMSVIPDGESWRIVGEGSERAVLAFATVVDKQLVYEVDPSPSA